MHTDNRTPKSFTHALDRVYRCHGFVVGEWREEPESCDYDAGAFTLDSRVVIFRSARVTPKKVGQFVTLWKRSENGPIRPYDLADEADLFVVSVKQGERCGQFIFPKGVLVERGIVSQGGVGGKRAIRVYPPWDAPDSSQGRRTQRWQLSYFLETSRGCLIDPDRTLKLLGTD